MHLLEQIKMEGTVSAIGGCLILIYSLFIMGKKICEHFGWFTEKHKEKENQKKEKRRQEFDEFMRPYNEKIDKITNDLQEQNLSQMRIEMDKIYEMYRFEKAIPRPMRTEFIRLYEIYHSKGGNHYMADIIYPEVMSWEIID